MAQLQKQIRKKSRPDHPIRTHIVKCKDFNPIVPKGVEMTFATIHPDGKHVVVVSQRRAV